MTVEGSNRLSKDENANSDSSRAASDRTEKKSNGFSRDFRHHTSGCPVEGGCHGRWSMKRGATGQEEMIRDKILRSVTVLRGR